MPQTSVRQTVIASIALRCVLGMLLALRSRYSGAKERKISLMEVMIESLHHVIDQLAGVFLALLGEVEIEHGSFELGMAHVALDDAQVDTGFEEMGGVGMAQRVYRNSFFMHAGILLSTAEGVLDA